MSATNETSTIGLSQYISTDKPTYLVDYNSDMLKIDNAIAADRGSIADVNTVAERADGKADTNKSSIDTLNEQINGDPTDPSDTGLAGKVTDNSSDIETMQSLIGNGTPTTSNQTIIGAINGLEGAVAPREDGDTLANSYAIGEQFARGGSVYTALTSLTAGTAFASLTLNTDYKVSDTLVEQLINTIGKLSELDTTDKSNVVSAINEIAGRLETQHSVSVTSDGVKTYGELLDSLYTAFLAELDNNHSYKSELLLVTGVSVTTEVGDSFNSKNDLSRAGWALLFNKLDPNFVTDYGIYFRASGSTFKSRTVSDGTITDLSATVAPDNKTLTLTYLSV